MSRFNTKGATSIARPKAVVTGTTVNHEGGTGYSHGELAELFNLAVVNFVGQDTFYEAGDERDARYNALVEQVATSNWPWLQGLLPWLRSTANMRTASLTAAAHAVHARLDAGEYDGNAALIDSVIQRADEVAEFLAYWQTTFGRALPKAVRNGLEKAIQRHYTERNALKWDSDARGLRMADVLAIIHPAPRTERGENDWQGKLFKYLLDERGHKDGKLATVPMLAARKVWYAQSDQDKVASLASGAAFQNAGITWENALSDLKSRVGEKAVWEAMAPHLPYMAATRNLRNMDEAGISSASANRLIARLTDPDEVTSSRLLPYRFLSAYLAAPSDRWKQALEDALNLALPSVPELPGRTLVLVDTSMSMTNNRLSAKSTVTSAMAAALFGAILAQRNPGRVDLHGFADHAFEHRIPKGQGVLKAAESLVARTNEAGWGTQMTASVRQTFKGHDRIFIISDMQCFADGTGQALLDGTGGWSRNATPIPVPESVKVYGMSLGGNGTTAIDSRVKNRFEFAGLTDQIFGQILALEAGFDERWPWLK